MKTHIIILSIILLACFNIQSQNYLISSSIGHSYFINKNAGGYNINLGLDKKISPKGYISFGIGHSFNDKTQFGKNLTDEKIILKDYTNRLPLGFGTPDWEEENAWPKIRLQSQPERFFRLDFMINYRQAYKAWSKSKLIFNVGGVLSYRDETELVKMIATQEISGFLIRPTYDHFIPLFSYNTFLDLGLNIGNTYSVTINDNLDIGLNTQFVYYPKSSHVIWNNGIKLIIKR